MNLSALPSPSVSTHLTTRPRPVSLPSDPISSIATYSSPVGAAATAVGYITSGGIAKTVTSNSGGALIPLRIVPSSSGGFSTRGFRSAAGRGVVDNTSVATIRAFKRIHHLGHADCEHSQY